MERRALGVVAVILIGLMAIVGTAGLDNLPPSLRKSVDAAGGLLSTDRAAFEQDRNQIESAISQEPALFQKEAGPWRSRLEHDRGQLDAAAAKLATVQQLAKANRRTDEYNVERGLNEFNSLRQEARNDASGARSEAERWLASKRTLPARIQAMRASYDALQAIDTGDAIERVRKAMVDWPAKRDDLQKRLEGLKELKAPGQNIWDASAGLRASAEANSLADSDVATLLSQADKMDEAARQAKESVAAIDALAAQLYVNWDKLLVGVDHGRDPQQRVRIVRTRYPGAALEHGETTSEERWEPLSTFRARDAEANAGMVIERKPAGEYDSEAERTVQPPAYAYIAPPGESNRYGSWSGGIWHWLPEYLILSQLLHASRGSISAPDYEAYQNARRRGDVFYGRNRAPDVPRGFGGGTSGTYSRPPGYSRPPPVTSPSSGGWYKERPQSSGGGGSQGYAGSRYQSRGTFSGSQYQSRGTFGSSGSRSSGGGSRSYSRSRGGRR